MKESFTCPHCGTLSLMHYTCISYRGYEVISLTENNREGDNWLNIASCHNCKKKTIWINNIYAYPDDVAEEANPEMPEAVKQLYNEAGLIYNKSPRAACALLRLAIDKGNPQSAHFWKKNGFIVIKEVDREGWTVLVSEKQL